MKIKKFHKKLVLNKRTIAHLSNSEQDVVKGGAVTRTCPSVQLCTNTDQECGTTCPRTGVPICAECE